MAFGKVKKKIAYECWQLAEVDPLEFSFVHVHCLVKAKWGKREGIGLIETVVLGHHVPSVFKDFLDGAH